LIEVLAVNAACVKDSSGFIARLLDQEGTLEKDLATCAAACAFAFAPREQFFVLVGVNVGTDEPADFAGRLPGAELES
jgi:hypothetical protein